MIFHIKKYGWMPVVFYIYEQKNGKSRKKRKRRSMINENKAELISSSQNNRQYRAQRAYVKNKRCMHVIRGSLMFLGSLLILVFNPSEANRGSFFHLLDPSWSNLFRLSKSFSNLLLVFGCRIAAAVLAMIIHGRIWVVVPLISPWSLMRTISRHDLDFFPTKNEKRWKRKRLVKVILLESVKGRLIRKEGVAGFLFMAWCAAAYYIYTIPDAVQHGSVGIGICTSLLNFHTLAVTIFFLDETTLHLLPIIVYTNNNYVENSGAVE